MHAAISSIMSPVQLCGYLLCGCVLLWAMIDLMRTREEDSPPASSEGSPASSPPTSPRTEAPAMPPVVQFPPELMQTMARQAEVLGQLMARQQTMREELQVQTLAAQRGCKTRGRA